MPEVRLRVIVLGLALLGARAALALDLREASGAPPPGPVTDSSPLAQTGSAQSLTPAESPLDAALSPSAALELPYGATGDLPSLNVPGLTGASSAPRPVDGEQAAQLRNYGRQVGQDWLKDTLGLDLQSMKLVWDPNTWRFVKASSLASKSRGSAKTAPGTVSATASSGLTVQLVQTDDLTHLTQGVRNVPYNVEVKGVFKPVQSLAAINTSLKIPLSPYDTWRADASMPFDWDEGDDPWWWRGLGLGKSLALHSGINSRLGFNQVETGMKTQWDPGFLGLGLWNLDYAWDLRYGEGSGESSNWLKISKNF